MKKKIDALAILGARENIFDIDGEYVIPLYQRAFAWEEKQLAQFVEDILDMEEGVRYYIGSLVVSKNNKKYEVVDGQQRLTSLYLLMSCLGMELKHTLSFACREKSNYTLLKIRDLIDGNRSGYDPERIENGLYQGIRILKEKVCADGFDRKSFLEKLRRVILYRIEVPENTDLNRYFEIMNTRGEQLEQHDILKAALMSYLPGAREKAVFAMIWEACSDMTGYVQMHFDRETREWIFGSEWGGLPSGKWADYRDIETHGTSEGAGLHIADMIRRDFEVAYDEAVDEDNTRVRFESMVEFPYFLLHVLKVFVTVNGVTEKKAGNGLVSELLDDKKLIGSFMRVMENGVWRGKDVDGDRKNFSRRFVMCLLRSRFLFDKYMVKREYANDSSDGEWSLKELHVSGQQSRKRPYYSNTRFIRSGEWSSTNDNRTKINIMIQSALRVSYTSPKVMHWITKLLCWLSADGCAHTDGEFLALYHEEAERIAIDAVTENFFRVSDDYAMGVSTPHIVFHYLDYLLWYEDWTSKKRYADFTFEFRNSVEHWYPQNPSEGAFEQWKDGVDQFGNLCIVQRNVNSRFSNMSPEAKKSTFQKMIDKGSIKLRLMRDLTEKNGTHPASVYWKETACRQHGEEMIQKLKKACGIGTDTAL